MLSQITILTMKYLSLTLKALNKLYSVNYSNLQTQTKKRILTSLILAPIFIFFITRGGVYYFCLCFGIGMLMVYELITMIAKIHSQNINFYNTYKKWGLSYIFATCVSLVLIRESAQGLRITLWLFAVIWGNDVFSFAVGKKYGSVLLAPKISPKKTYEGAIAGIVGGMLISIALYHIFRSGLDDAFDLMNFSIFTFIIIILGQAGDLTESWLKRQCDIKDSGSIIPGHGGILDRFDSIMMVAPIIYIVLFFNRGILF